MKKLFSLLAVIALATSLQASYTPTEEVKSKGPKATEILIPLGGTDQKISLQELATISAEELENRTGREMTKGDLAAFKAAQRKLNRAIAEDGTITSKKIRNNAAAMGEGGGSGIGGFALGFLLGLIGVLISYIINDDNKKNRTKWAWIGFGVWVLLYIIILAAA